MAACGRAPLGGLSPVRGQSAGTAASWRVTQSLPAPPSAGARPAAQNAALRQERGQCPWLGSRAERADGALRTGKIIRLLPSLPKGSVFKQPKARGFSTRGLRCRALVLPTLWGQQEQGDVSELCPIRLEFSLGKQDSLWTEESLLQVLSEPGLAQGLVQVLVRHQSCCPLEPF